MAHSETMTVFQDDEIPKHWPVLDFINWLNGQVSRIPEKYRDSSTLRFSIEYDSSVLGVTVCYERTYTPEELEERARRQEQSIKDGVAITEQRERDQLARLKAKYES